MTEPPPPEHRPPDPPLPADRRVAAEQRLDLTPIRTALTGTIVAVTVLVVTFVAAGFLALGAPGIQQRGALALADVFELLKLSFALVGGLGATVALVMAYRRQRVAEADNQLSEEIQAHRRRMDEELQRHQETIAEDARHDAAERRLTELYTAAAELLGSDKAPVRLAGLYALERLAQANPDHRQTVVNLLCAYLRMPWSPTPPPAAGGEQPAADAAAAATATAREEREVRRTAQRILTGHLRPADAATYWSGIELDLTGAALDAIDLRGVKVTACLMDRAVFYSAPTLGGRYAGRLSLAWAVFHTPLDLSGATFSGEVTLDGAEFQHDVTAERTTFAGRCSVKGATFGGDAMFGGARFRRLTADGAAFARTADFTAAEFGRVSFHKVEFGRDASFARAVFTDTAIFAGASFDRVSFDDAQFRAHVSFRTTQFTAEAGFAGARFAEGANFDASRTSAAFSLAGASARPTDPRVKRLWPPGWTVDDRRDDPAVVRTGDSA